MATYPASLERKLRVITGILTLPYMLYFVKQQKSSMRIDLNILDPVLHIELLLNANMSKTVNLWRDF